MSTTRLVAELMRFAVLERVRQLRQRSYADLRAMPLQSFENVAIEDRQVPITLAIDRVSDERLRVVVQGWAENWALGTSVFTDGFLKSKDESVDSLREPYFDEHA